MINQNENITEEKIDDVLVVKTSYTSVTTVNAAPFKQFLITKIDNGEDKIVVDLSDIGYMDSSFLGSLVLSLKKSVASGGILKLIISKDENPLRTMFENTQMFKVFEAYQDLDSALNSFK